MKEIVLVGGGGHCRACIDVIEQQGLYTIAGIVDVADKRGSSVLGYAVFATDNDLLDLINKYTYFLITLGQIKRSDRRIELFNVIYDNGGKLPAIVSPLAYVSKHTKIGHGTIIMHHALINAGAVIGDNCIVNTKALIEHDVVIRNHCHMATGSIVNGGVVIENGVFVGSGAVIRESILVGRNTTIGCNSTVKQSVSPGSMLR
ncbi:NeuD/PglB/VioB family sugar acetyltransferase [uncultured Desulfobulbus sp.]|uniref:NeuD/PglB/VioB family sugar acetyltransferase n=1 Tax=uncultured Desulfobulbus sp. TaxID=239745 RepID=UPI0029C6406F|nr:NeuD/PglB/VioB family sugar acetyltransferase [uncultured Desulfobulbus sp.]